MDALNFLFWFALWIGPPVWIFFDGRRRRRRGLGAFGFALAAALIPILFPIVYVAVRGKLGAEALALEIASPEERLEAASSAPHEDGTRAGANIENANFGQAVGGFIAVLVVFVVGGNVVDVLRGGDEGATGGQHERASSDPVDTRCRQLILNRASDIKGGSFEPRENESLLPYDIAWKYTITGNWLGRTVGESYYCVVYDRAKGDVSILPWP